MNPLLPWILLGAIALSGVTGALGYWQGGKHKADEIEAQIGRDAATAARVEEAAQKGAAEAISQIEVKNVTIRQRTEKEIEKVPVLRDCTAPDSVRALTDAALAGSEPTGNSELPAANPDGRGDVR